MDSYSIDDTIAYARRLAGEAQPGDIICLDGDLGVGKTVFAKGFAEGLGITAPITSPTFTIMNIYDEGRLPLYHYDVYRIEDESEMDELGYEEYFFGQGVTLIEWASQIPDCIPASARHIIIKKDPEKGVDYREISTEAQDDAFCNNLYKDYLNDPDRGQGITLEEAAAELGVAL